MIEPTTPLPTMTTSTGFIFVAVTLFPPFPFQHDVLHEAFCVDLCLAELDVEDADRRGVIRFGIVEVFAVRAGGHAGKSQQRPSALAAVAAIHRIGKETFLSVAPEQIEK